MRGGAWSDGVVLRQARGLPLCRDLVVRGVGGWLAAPWFPFTPQNAGENPDTIFPLFPEHHGWFWIKF